MSFIGVIMLMGLVAKNAILLLDCARKEEAQGVDREEALMHAGRVRLRPILMTTFALIAGMMPVAIGLGEGGEFYRPMAVAIIGGTITSTLLTLLVVPTFYDSHRDRQRPRDGQVPPPHRALAGPGRVCIDAGRGVPHADAGALGLSPGDGVGGTDAQPQASRARAARAHRGLGRAVRR